MKLLITSVFFLVSGISVLAADLFAPNRLPAVMWQPGVTVGVPGGIDQYRAGGASERPIQFDAAVSIPGSALVLSRNALSTTGTSTARSSSITVADTTPFVVGNSVGATNAIRTISWWKVRGPVTSNGNITVYLGPPGSGTEYTIALLTTDTSLQIVQKIAAGLPGTAQTPYPEADFYYINLHLDNYAITQGTFNFGTTGLTSTSDATSGSLSISTQSYGGTIASIDGSVLTMATPTTTAMTGVTFTVNNSAALAAAVSAVNANYAFRVPPGVYVMQSGISFPTSKNNVTLRADGSFVNSTTSNSIGTGAKVFTVPAGIDWSPGVGVRVHNRFDANQYMQGVVTDYTGTTLTLNINQVGGEGTFANWKVSVTCFIWAGTSGPAFKSSSHNYQLGAAQYLSAPAAKGATSFTLASTTGITTGKMIHIAHDNYNTAADAIVADGPLVIGVGGSASPFRRHTAIVTNVVGNVVSFSPAINWDLEMSKNPRVSPYPGYSTGIGFEGFAVYPATGNTNGAARVVLDQTLNSWLYDVEVQISPNYMVEVKASVNPELRKLWFGQRQGAGTNGAGLLTGDITGMLIEDTVSVNTFPLIELNSSTNYSAFAYNFGIGSVWNINHGPHNSFNLYEGNVGEYMQSDGYFGSASNETFYRNWLRGTSSGGTGWIVLNRFYRYANIAKNVQGQPGLANGNYSFGNPNMGNGSYTTSIDTTLGQVWTELSPGIIGTVQTKVSNSIVEVYMEGGGSPSVLNDENWPWALYWEGGSRGGARLVNMPPNGTMWRFEDGPNAGGTAYPEAGTTIRMYPGSIGYQQQDLAVGTTALVYGNRLASSAGGSSISTAIPEGAATPASFMYSSRPPWLSMDYAWPPVEADTFAFPEAETVIPAASRYYGVEGTVVPTVATPSFSPSGTTFSSPQNITITTETSGATLYWMTGNGTLNEETGTLYEGPVSIGYGTTRLRAIAVKAEHTTSLRDVTYTITAPDPDPDPEPSATNTTITGDLNATRIQLVVP
jgi:hypothetical protein